MSQGKFLHVNVPGDGDCFFHSIAGYMFIDKHHNLKNTSNSALHKMAKDNVFDVVFVKNLRKQVVSWLKKNVHQYGNLYEVNPLLKKITSKELDLSYFKKHIKERYINKKF